MPSHIGKYEIRGLIGRGGFGSVYEGYDPAVGRRVAIKVLLSSGDEQLLARFRQEASAAGNLRHKNIVTIYEYGEHEGAAFIAMEYLEGSSLQAIIKHGPPMDLLRKVQIMREVAEGLQYAHSQKVVHRDVKPDNIMVQTDGSVKIMDFGIARLLGHDDARVTQPGLVIGTLLYMPPEQFAGHDPGTLGDIYAYGAVYYQLLSGKPPFEAVDGATALYQVLNVVPAPLSAAVPGCPPALEALVFRALEKDPKARYQSMEEVLLDSEPFLQELRKQRASELVERARQAFHEKNIEVAQDLLRESFTLDPSSRQAQELLQPLQLERISRQRSLRGTPPKTAAPSEPAGEFTRMIQAPQTPQPAGPSVPHSVPQKAPPGSSSGPGEFTRMFQTSPPPTPAGPAVPATAPDKPAAEESTRLFVVPRPAAEQPAAAEEEPPTDTALTISNCADAAFLNVRTTLDHFPFTIGRADADWNLTFDRAISRRHAQIEYRDGGFFIRDLGTANGTFVNGRRLSQPEVLLFGARILLGSNTEIVFGSGVLKEIPDLCGTLVGNRFLLQEKLYSSSKSVLYRAQDQNLPRQVAVKLLSPSLIRHAGYREQFTREAQTASRLRHPRICQVLDYGELRLADSSGGRTLYVCMEYLPGGSFNSRLKRLDPVPLPQIASWLDAICDALAYIHENNVVHSGIKPTAIVFDAAENPHLTDFAFATRPGAGLQQSVIGSPAFLAPEQWDGAEPVPATDQYSLAVLFYWLIAGAPPFEGQEHVLVRNNNFLRGAMPAHEMAAKNGRPTVPARLSPVLQQALALKPADRYANTRDLAAAFRAAMADPAPVRSGPPSVFVSYQRSESSLLADMLKKEMERETGFYVFVDAIQQDATGQFPLKLRRRIEQCDAFVCLLGRTTLASDWVKLEIEVAAKHGKPMIPVFQEGYRPRDVRTLEPQIQELLAFEGIKILDQQNLFVDAAIQSLIALTRRSIEHPEPRIPSFQTAEGFTARLKTRLLAFARRFLRTR